MRLPSPKCPVCHCGSEHIKGRAWRCVACGAIWGADPPKVDAQWFRNQGWAIRLLPTGELPGGLQATYSVVSLWQADDAMDELSELLRKSHTLIGLVGAEDVAELIKREPGEAENYLRWAGILPRIICSGYIPADIAVQEGWISNGQIDWGTMAKNIRKVKAAVVPPAHPSCLSRDGDRISDAEVTAIFRGGWNLKEVSVPVDEGMGDCCSWCADREATELIAVEWENSHYPTGDEGIDRGLEGELLQGEQRYQGQFDTMCRSCLERLDSDPKHHAPADLAEKDKRHLAKGWSPVLSLHKRKGSIRAAKKVPCSVCGCETSGFWFLPFAVEGSPPVCYSCRQKEVAAWLIRQHRK